MSVADYIDLIEQQNKEQDNIYARVATAFGVSNTALWVLYIVSVTEGAVTQQDLCRACFYPKQTVNSTISALAERGYARLEAVEGSRRSKRVVLTESGQELALRTAKRLRAAEIRAYGRLSERELAAYLETSKRLTALLKEETERL